MNEEFDVIRDDPAGYRILECSVAGGSDYIVTGDNLLKLDPAPCPALRSNTSVPELEFISITFRANSVTLQRIRQASVPCDRMSRWLGSLIGGGAR